MNKEYMLIGLTGPTGAGKTTVTDIFRELGYAIVNADEIAHKALLESELICALTKAFGEDIQNSDGSLNRREIATKAFSSKENTQLLNSLTHPVILRLSKKEFEKLSYEGYEKIIFDAPTLFESGSDKLCRKIIAVIAKENLRIKRIMVRDGITEDEAKARIKAQKNCEYYSERADFTIENSGCKTALYERVIQIDKELHNE